MNRIYYVKVYVNKDLDPKLISKYNNWDKKSPLYYKPIRYSNRELTPDISSAKKYQDSSWLSDVPEGVLVLPDHNLYGLKSSILRKGIERVEMVSFDFNSLKEETISVLTPEDIIKKNIEKIGIGKEYIYRAECKINKNKIDRNKNEVKIVGLLDLDGNSENIRIIRDIDIALDDHNHTEKLTLYLDTSEKQKQKYTFLSKTPRAYRKIFYPDSETYKKYLKTIGQCPGISDISLYRIDAAIQDKEELILKI